MSRIPLDGIPLGCSADKVDVLELLFGNMTRLDQESVYVRNMCSLISARNCVIDSGQKEMNLERRVCASLAGCVLLNDPVVGTCKP